MLFVATTHFVRVKPLLTRQITARPDVRVFSPVTPATYAVEDHCANAVGGDSRIQHGSAIDDSAGAEAKPA